VPVDLAFISQPTRQQILRLVWRSERTAGDIAAALPVTFGAVSQHLGALRKAGLVRLRRQGRIHWYAAERDAFGLLAPALEQMWFGKLGELKRLAESEQRRIDRATHN
jgi:DNA-binding transcriptional ArsR family regulator